MIKYASNAVLATMISFSNEIARLCTAVGGVDAIEVMRGVHQASYFTMRRDNDRITAPIASFLEPGCGFGGSCLPKDVTALIGQGREKGVPLNLLQSVLDINRGQARRGDAPDRPSLRFVAGCTGCRARDRIQARYRRRARVPGISDHSSAQGARARA